MALLKRSLVDPQVLDRLLLATSQTARNGALLDPGHLIPRTAQPPGHRPDARFTKPVDGQAFEQRRKPAARLRPWDGNLPHAVLGATHPRDLGGQDGPELTSIEMPPASTALVVTTAGRAALGTP